MMEADKTSYFLKLYNFCFVVNRKGRKGKLLPCGKFSQERKGITANPVTIPFKVLNEIICFLLSEINKAHLPWKPKSPAHLFLKKHTMHQFWEQLQEVSFNEQPALK